MMRFCLAPQIFLPTNWENIIIFGFLVVYVDFDAVENLHLTWPCIDPPYILMLFCCSVISDSLGPYGLQHARLPCPSPSSEICSNRYSLSRWCHTTISSSVIPFSSCPQSFSASGSFPMSRLFSSGGYSIGASASASVLPMSIQSWFPLVLNWFALLAAQETIKSLLQHHSSKTSIPRHSAFSTTIMASFLLIYPPENLQSIYILYLII